MRSKQQMLDFVRDRIVRRAQQRGESREVVQQLGDALDPNVLTVVFARRFAEYNRPALLFRHPNRLARMLNDPHRPVQFIFAGKAHPDDENGKAILHEVALQTRRPEYIGRMDVLQNEVVGLYYQRDANGLPRGWIARMKHAFAVAHQFNTDRMLKEYVLRYYLPAACQMATEEAAS